MDEKPIPRTRAKTAYGLLSEVCRLILAEPKRYNQRTFIERSDESLITVDAPEGFPPCGTIGCVAGWVATLTTRKTFTYTATADIASRVLGLTGDQSSELFEMFAASGSPQTRAHARSGVRHIRRFQKAHAAQLKAKRL